jgi:hypothetical protein
MSRELLIARISTLGQPFHVDATRLTHNQLETSQTVLTRNYGGKPNRLFPKISNNKFQEHGFDHWMTPDPNHHPFLPPSPGWPGLVVFADGDQRIEREMRNRLFRVVIQRSPGHFEYAGQYELKSLGRVSPGEWNSQADAVFLFLVPVSFESLTSSV